MVHTVELLCTTKSKSETSWILTLPAVSLRLLTFLREEDVDTTEWHAPNHDKPGRRGTNARISLDPSNDLRRNKLRGS